MMLWSETSDCRGLFYNHFKTKYITSSSLRDTPSLLQDHKGCTPKQQRVKATGGGDAGILKGESISKPRTSIFYFKTAQKEAKNRKLKC